MRMARVGTGQWALLGSVLPTLAISFAAVILQLGVELGLKGLKKSRFWVFCVPVQNGN